MWLVIESWHKEKRGTLAKVDRALQWQFLQGMRRMLGKIFSFNHEWKECYLRHEEKTDLLLARVIESMYLKVVLRCLTGVIGMVVFWNQAEEWLWKRNIWVYHVAFYFLTDKFYLICVNDKFFMMGIIIWKYQ